MQTLRTLLILLLFGLHLFATSAWGGNTVSVDQYNRATLNGEPFFPIGLYVVECTNGSYANELDEIGESPFNTLMNYAMHGCGSAATYHQIRDYLDELSARDLYLIYSLKEYVSTCNDVYEVCDEPGPLPDDSINKITQKVTNHMDHDAVVAWYLNDETCPDCLEQLQDAYDLVKLYDPNHPVWSVHWNSNWLLQETHTTDIVGADSYPIPDNPITRVSNVVDHAMESEKPLWFVPQLFEWPNKRPPTKDEMRAMTYLAVNHGAKGLIYYSYFDIRNDVDYSERWVAIQDIASEIRRLRHVFMSIDQANEADTTCDRGAIDFKLMRDGDSYYLFAVNTAAVAVDDVSFTINLRKKPETVYELFNENDSESVVDPVNGTFTSNFDPYGVRVFQWQNDTDLAASATSDNIIGLSIRAVDPSDPDYDGTNKPKAFLYQPVDMEIEVEKPEQTAVIEIFLPNSAPSDYAWYKYSSGEWIDFSRNLISNDMGDGATFNEDRTRISLHITDNGPYDDNPTDRIILDPSGLGTMSSASSTNPATPTDDGGGGGGGGGGGCFVTSLD